MEKAEINVVRFSDENVIATSGFNFMEKFTPKSYSVTVWGDGYTSIYIDEKTTISLTESYYHGESFTRNYTFYDENGTQITKMDDPTEPGETIDLTISPYNMFYYDAIKGNNSNKYHVYLDPKFAADDGSGEGGIVYDGDLVFVICNDTTKHSN